MRKVEPAPRTSIPQPAHVFGISLRPPPKIEYDFIRDDIVFCGMRKEVAGHRMDADRFYIDDPGVFRGTVPIRVRPRFRG